MFLHLSGSATKKDKVRAVYCAVNVPTFWKGQLKCDTMGEIATEMLPLKPMKTINKKSSFPAKGSKEIIGQWIETLHRSIPSTKGEMLSTAPATTPSSSTGFFTETQKRACFTRVEKELKAVLKTLFAEETERETHDIASANTAASTGISAMFSSNTRTAAKERKATKAEKQKAQKLRVEERRGEREKEVI